MFSAQILGACFALVATGSGVWAESYKVERTIPIEAPDEAWKIMGDFCDIDDWHPAVQVCQLRVIDGALHRVLKLTGGGEFVEKRIAEEPGISFTYTIESSPLPIEGYVATMAITRGETPMLTWSGSFRSDDPQMEGVIAGIYDSGMASIAEMLGP